MASPQSSTEVKARTAATFTQETEVEDRDFEMSITLAPEATVALTPGQIRVFAKELQVTQFPIVTTEDNQLAAFYNAMEVDFSDADTDFFQRGFGLYNGNIEKLCDEELNALWGPPPKNISGDGNTLVRPGSQFELFARIENFENMIHFVPLFGSSKVKAPGDGQSTLNVPDVHFHGDITKITDDLWRFTDCRIDSHSVQQVFGQLLVKVR